MGTSTFKTLRIIRYQTSFSYFEFYIFYEIEQEDGC